MMILIVSVCRPQIQYRRKTSAESGWPVAFIKINGTNHIRMKHGNEPSKMVYIKKGCTIHQDEILILTAAPYQEMRITFLAARHPWQKCQSFHDISEIGRASCRERV